jgi:hypothetical protein
MNIKHATVHWEADGSAVNIDLGFIPEFAILFESTGQTNPNIYYWFKRFVDDQSMYGLLLTGSTGVVTRVTTAATGIDSLDSKYHQVMVESPVPGRGEIACDVADWASGTSYSSGARSSTTIGTIVRPPTHNGYVYELTTATGNGTSEPSSWTTTPGQTSTDGGSNVWTCREEKVVVGGAQGLTVGATTQTDGRENFLAAWGNPRDRDAGDAADYGANSAI